MSEETEPIPFSGERRSHRKLVRFDPTFSAGALAQIVTVLGGLLIAYGKYESDRATVRLEIEQIKVNALGEKLAAKEAITELRNDVREVQKTITSVDRTVTGIKAEIDAAKKGKQ